MPDNLTTATARVIDPILTNHARGYIHPERVGHLLFPFVYTPQRGGRRIEFNKDSFRLYNTLRAPGAKRKEIEFGFLGAKFAIEQHDLVGKVPQEILQEAARGPGIDLGRQATQGVQDIMSLRLEYDQSVLARNAANYDANHKVTLAGADQWSHVDSDPKDDVKAGKEAVRATTGMYPNTMILGPSAFSALDDHPAILDKFKYTSSESVTTAMLARYFDVATVEVGKAVYAGDDDVFVDVWGNDVVLAYVPPAAARSLALPSYGYTYRLDGHPVVEQAYFDRDDKSWKYPVVDEFSPEQVGAEAGFLIKDAV